MAIFHSYVSLPEGTISSFLGRPGDGPLKPLRFRLPPPGGAVAPPPPKAVQERYRRRGSGAAGATTL